MFVAVKEMSEDGAGMLCFIPLGPLLLGRITCTSWALELFFWDSVLYYRSVWPWTHCVALAALKLGTLLLFPTPQVQRLWAWTIVPSSWLKLWVGWEKGFWWEWRGALLQVGEDLLHSRILKCESEKVYEWVARQSMSHWSEQDDAWHRHVSEKDGMQVSAFSFLVSNWTLHRTSLVIT